MLIIMRRLIGIYALIYLILPWFNVHKGGWAGAITSVIGSLFLLMAVGDNPTNATIPFLIIGMLLISGGALIAGRRMFGAQIHWSHHLVRLVIEIVLVGLFLVAS
ncbi:MAG TPA: hypothetical protein DCW31_07240 [Lactobacillus sp.]|nr:hypothetical protein [Lactobacillus sp.]